MKTVGSSVISVRKLHKKYQPNIQALADVSVDVERGEFVFLTGASGSGKSTLLKLLYANERPSEGQIWIDGVEISSLSSSQLPFVRRKLGIIFQDFKLIPYQTVFENVSLSLEVTGLSRKQIKSKVEQVMDNLGILSKAHLYPMRLSGGEQQRVAIARAIVNNPNIILADEPTANLDAERSDDVMALIKGLNQKGATVIFATHNHEFFKDQDCRVCVLKNGMLQEKESR